MPSYQYRRLTLACLGLLSLLSGCRGGDAFSIVMQDAAMEPTLSARMVVLFKPTSNPRYGDVVAFEYPFPYPGRPRRELIARVIGLAGDHVIVNPAGVYRNGTLLSEPHAKNQNLSVTTAITIPDGFCFVVGDDRANQRDSRWWGPLPLSRVLGVADGLARRSV